MYTLRLDRFPEVYSYTALTDVFCYAFDNNIVTFRFPAESDALYYTAGNKKALVLLDQDEVSYIELQSRTLIQILNLIVTWVVLPETQDSRCVILVLKSNLQ